MQLQVGKSYIWKGKVVKLTAKWAQGKFFTYTFDDGSHFNGDPLPLVTSGELKIHVEEFESPPLMPKGSLPVSKKPGKMPPPKWEY